MRELFNMIKLLDMKHKMSAEEKDALLSELIASYASGKPCYLMQFLMNDDFLGFKAYVAYMVKEGLSIKEVIQSNIDLPQEAS